MNLTPGSPMSPLTFRADRRQHKQRLIAHRRERSVALGPCMRLQFEDAQTLQDRPDEHGDHRTDIVEAYTLGMSNRHRVSDGSHWQATLTIELPDAAERDRELPRLSEAAQRLYVEVPRHPRVFAETNSGMPTRYLTRPSAVHFLRFQFPPPLRVALLAGASAGLGCAHDQYAFRRVIPLATLERLRCDLAAMTSN